ncbi:MAG: pectic acid lyase [Planctomycetales bacterium]|nr:pectic acid lyase [Planctomycetales bacterium]
MSRFPICYRAAIVRGTALAVGLVLLTSRLHAQPADDAPPSRAEIRRALSLATEFFHGRVAVHGGYVFHYSLDLRTRWGEGLASREQIWVQPPGTPTVGEAFLDAYSATGDAAHLEAAVEAGEALLYGQLRSGGWTSAIDFDPSGERIADYANGRGRGRNYSTLDDDTTQGALRFLIRLDRTLEFEHVEIHAAVRRALDTMLAAQFPNGAFPQVWQGPSPEQPIRAAVFPDYDWRVENRIKEYWNLYTLNDDLAGDMVALLVLADATYDDPRYSAALRRLGDFLILAQLPEPQPAWAQQYDYGMRPAWARKFEPPAITGSESQNAIEALLEIYRFTGDEKYLAPIPAALRYLSESELPDGRLARFRELETNRPLYMNQDYELTYDDTDVPTHYAWKVASHVDRLTRRYESLRENPPDPTAPIAPLPRDVSAAAVRRILDDLDDQGRWISVRGGERLVGQPKIAEGESYLSSEVFARNMRQLADAVRSLDSNE